MGIVVYLMVLTLCVNALCNPEPKPVDCRKFVFAPLCRGVAAKRSSPLRTALRSGIIIEASKLKDLLKGYNVGADVVGEDIVFSAEAMPSGRSRPTKNHESQVPIPPFYDYDHNK